MGIIIRQSVQNTINSYIGIALGFIITIFLFPRILTPEQYGLTRVLLSLAVVGTQFANLGMNNTVVRFFPYFRDEEKNHHGFLFIALIVPLFGFLLLSIFYFLFQDNIIQYFSDRSSLLIDYYWYLLPLAFFILYFNVLNYFIRALFDTLAASFLNEVFIRVLTAILLVIYIAGWITFEQFVSLFVINYGIIFVLLFMYALARKNTSLKPDFEFLSRSLLKKLFNYSIYAYFGGVATIIVSNIDIIMLSSLAGLEETGIYAIAFYIGSVILVVRSSILKISSPIIASALKDEDYKLVSDIYKRSSLNSLIGGGLFFCGILANMDNLMSLLPEAYRGGSIVILIIASVKLFDMATGLNGAIILNSKEYRFDLYSTIFLVAVTVVLNYLLIPQLGILGAAIGTATALFLYNVFKVVFVWIRFSMQPFVRSMLWIIGVGAFVLFINFQIEPMGNVYLDILIRSTAIVIVYLVPIIYMNISKDFNNLILKTIRATKDFF